MTLAVRNVRFRGKSGHRPRGRACPLCPQLSDIYLLSNGQSIINLDAKIPGGTLYLAMAKQELDRSQIAGTSVDQGRFGSS